jgi:hypothetical protein
MQQERSRTFVMAGLVLYIFIEWDFVIRSRCWVSETNSFMLVAARSEEHVGTDLRDMLKVLKADLRETTRYLMIQSAEDSSTSNARQTLRPSGSIARGLPALSKLQKHAAKELLLALHCSADTEDFLMSGRQLRQVSTVRKSG